MEALALAQSLQSREELQLTAEKIPAHHQSTDHRLESSLCHEESIERILVNGKEFFDLCRVFADDRQVIEARLVGRELANMQHYPVNADMHLGATLATFWRKKDIRF